MRAYKTAVPFPVDFVCIAKLYDRMVFLWADRLDEAWTSDSCVLVHTVTSWKAQQTNRYLRNFLRYGKISIPEYRGLVPCLTSLDHWQMSGVIIEKV